MQNGQRKLHIPRQLLCKLIHSPIPPTGRSTTLRTPEWNATLSPELRPSSFSTYILTKCREYGHTATLPTTWNGLSPSSEAGIREPTSWKSWTRELWATWRKSVCEGGEDYESIRGQYIARYHRCDIGGVTQCTSTLARLGHD